ncbi:hypothetical protein [Pseudarthrobacter sp. YAF2]|uniref:hypothetical protein n=1 Tax=Pseudarthrobacter sp. YAF2 TaxID=3233078 RepID=UPI003F96CDE0
MSWSINASQRLGAILPLLLLALAPAANADTGSNALVPYDGPSFENCALTRIGTQLVRCDNLTGAGVTAPLWIPEQQ